MEIKKITLYFCISLFLTGCYQSTAMVGPAITFASTGNVSQAGLAYITNKAVKEETGMTATEYVSTILEERNNNKKEEKGKKMNTTCPVCGCDKDKCSCDDYCDNCGA